MKKLTKIFLGFLFILPSLYVALFMLAFLWQARYGWLVYDLLKFPHVLIMFLSPVLLIASALWAYNGALLKKEERVLWLFILFVGNVFALPVFWYYFIMRFPNRNGAGFL